MSGTISADTIFALASGERRAAIAVLRLSGPGTDAALAALLRGALPPPRHASLRGLHDPAGGELLDRAVVIRFPGPGSFTGEDAAELHLHGSPAVIDAVAAALAGLGLRPAEAGEFTRRAFDHGRLDLTEVEGLADLIAAETAAQRRQALRQMEGALGRLYAGWGERLVRALAHVEAGIDFADEELPDGLIDQARTEATALAAEIEAHLADGRRGELVREGFRIAIVGPPNAGKSSLLNLLAGREAAIVSTVPGTTRDAIEVRLDLAGHVVIVTDTAGIREAAEAIEAEGIRRAEARAREADLVLLLLDGATVEGWRAVEHLAGPAAWPLANKADLGPWRGPAEIGGEPVRAISVKTGEGVDALLRALGRAVAARVEGSGTPSLTRLRHRRALEEACGALRRSAAAQELALAAEDIRLALRALGRIVGKVDVEDLLDVIFRDFCIGK